MPNARTRRLLAALLALVLALAALAGPASAQATPTNPGDPTGWAGPESRIVGGTKAPAGAWPSVVSLTYDYGDGYSEAICAGTIIDPTWILTAAHCVSDGPGRTLPVQRLTVRVGTQDLAHGGQSIRVARIIVRPSFSYRTGRDDIALVQLERPTDRPRPLEVASPTDVPWGNASVTSVGWGGADDLGSDSSTELRQVGLPAMTGAECKTSLEDQAPELSSFPYHSSFLCTGPIGSGGKGPCYGDDGGPLVWETGGRKIIVGVSSFNPGGCGSPEAPSVFSKVASASRWIAQTIQYGPHRDAEDFAFALAISYLDFDPNWGPDVGAGAGEPGAQIAAYHGEYFVTRRDATIVRLYDAILGRRAESLGYQYWRERMFYPGYGPNGETSPYSAIRVAEVMARSVEFRTTYGSLDDESFVEQLYQNVLGRAGAPGDVSYWTGRLTAGDSRGKVAALIAESAENRTATQAEVDVQVAFLNLLGRVPADYEMDQWTVRPIEETARFLVHTVAYARRWGGYYYDEGF